MLPSGPPSNPVLPPPTDAPPVLPPETLMTKLEMREEIERLKEELQLAKFKEAELTATTQKMEARAKKLRTHMGQQIQVLQQQLEQDRKKQQKMRDMLEEAVTEIEKQDNYKRTTEKEKAELVSMVSLLKRQMEEALREKVEQPELEIQLEEEKKQREDLRKKLEKSLAEIEKQKEIITQYQENTNRTEEGKQQELERVQEELRNHRQLMNELKSELEATKTETENQNHLTSLLETAKEEIEQGKKILITKDEKITNLETELAQLKSDLDTANKKKEEFRKKLTEQISGEDHVVLPKKEEPKKEEPKKEELKKEEPKKEEPKKEPKQETLKKEDPKKAKESQKPKKEPDPVQKPESGNPSAELPNPVSEEIRLWAWDIIGVSSEAGFDPYEDWGSRQILGEPRVAGYGDSGFAWAPLETNAGHEWIAVRFRRRVFISEVLILESWHPGAVYKVEALKPDGEWDTIWSTVAEPAPEELRIVQANPTHPLTYPSDGIKIHLNTAAVSDEWNELAAVQIAGKTVPGDPIPQDDEPCLQRPQPIQKKRRPSNIKNEFSELTVSIPSDTEFSLRMLTGDLLEAGKCLLRKVEGDHWAQRSKEEIALIKGEPIIKEVEEDVDVMSALARRFEAIHGENLEDVDEWNDEWDDGDTNWGDDDADILY